MILPRSPASKLVRATASLLLLLFAATLGAAPPASPGLTPGEQRGKDIYLQGTTAAGKEIGAFLEDSGLEVPASVLPCVNCHGYEGEGKPEGGVVPSNITWDALTRSYTVKLPSGREHHPYTKRSLALAISAGIDPGGKKLLGAMPRYRISREDLDDLVAYLQRIGKDHDPGISDTTLTLGMLVPSSGATKELGQAMRAVQSAYWEDVNGRGGIYSRKIDLKVAEWSGSGTDAALSAARGLIDDEKVFALDGAFIAGADEELAHYFQERQVPLVAPFTLKPPNEFPLNRYVFYLFSGIEAQARVLMRVLHGRLQYESPHVVIVRPDSDLVRNTADAIVSAEESKEQKPITQTTYPPGHFDAVRICSELSAAGVNVVLFLGSGAEEKMLVDEAARIHWTPVLLLPGSLASREIFSPPAAFKNKIYVAFPTLPSDQSERGSMEFAEFAKRHNLPRQHFAAQLATYCSAKIMAEGLKQSGRDLSREKLVVALEGLYDFETGLTPKISFGPNRRIGAAGAYVMKIDPEKGAFAPAGDWIDLEGR